jgi:hypothetical protein
MWGLQLTDAVSLPPDAEHPLLLHETLQSSYPEQEAQQQSDWQEAVSKNSGILPSLSDPAPVRPGFSSGFWSVAAKPVPPTASRSVQNAKNAMTFFTRICTP